MKLISIKSLIAQVSPIAALTACNLFVLWLCISCGYEEKLKAEQEAAQQQQSQPSAVSPNATTTTTTTTNPYATNSGPNQKEVVVEYRKVNGDYIKTYKATSELPQCQHSIDAQMAYIKPENKFFECHEDRWLETDPSETVAGSIPAHADEIVTKDQQKAEQEAKKPEPTSANQWTDVITGKRWLVGGVAPYMIARESCGDKYRLPNRIEAIDAATHGIGAAFAASGLNEYWIAELDLATSISQAYRMQLTPAMKVISTDMLKSYTAVCIEK